MTSKENYLQVMIYILTIMFIVTVPTDTVAANHLAAWAVFWECLNITQLFGRIDFFGRGIFMAFDVSKEIGKTLLVFAPSMVAFILAFNMMFQSNLVFNSLSSTSAKILVMMQGEFDFDDNLSYQKVKEEGGRNRSIQVKELSQDEILILEKKRRLITLIFTIQKGSPIKWLDNPQSRHRF